MPAYGDCTISTTGEGFTGLAAAHRLIELRPREKAILVEAGDRLGGVFQTEHQDGFFIEHGADNFITTSPVQPAGR